jgi:hypothetical protein
VESEGNQKLGFYYTHPTENPDIYHSFVCFYDDDGLVNQFPIPLPRDGFVVNDDEVEAEENGVNFLLQRYSTNIKTGKTEKLYEMNLGSDFGVIKQFIRNQSFSVIPWTVFSKFRRQLPIVYSSNPRVIVPDKIKDVVWEEVFVNLTEWNNLGII